VPAPYHPGTGQVQAGSCAANHPSFDFRAEAASAPTSCYANSSFDSECSDRALACRPRLHKECTNSAKAELTFCRIPRLGIGDWASARPFMAETFRSPFETRHSWRNPATHAQPKCTALLRNTIEVLGTCRLVTIRAEAEFCMTTEYVEKTHHIISLIHVMPQS